MEILRTITLQGERPWSWNMLYAGKHWGARRAEAARVHGLVREQIGKDERPFEHPVAIRFVVYFKGRLQDSCNICDKMYTDGMLAIGEDYEDGYRSLLWDDDPRYVTSTTTVPRHDKDNPRVVIEIIKENDNELQGNIHEQAHEEEQGQEV